MNKDGENDGYGVPREHKRCDVSERYDCYWVEQEENPDSLVVERKDVLKQHYHEDRYVRLANVTEHVRGPVGRNADSRDQLHVFELLLSFFDDQGNYHTRNYGEGDRYKHRKVKCLHSCHFLLENVELGEGSSHDFELYIGGSVCEDGFVNILSEVGH